MFHVKQKGVTMGEIVKAIFSPIKLIFEAIGLSPEIPEPAPPPAAPTAAASATKEEATTTASEAGGITKRRVKTPGYESTESLLTGGAGVSSPANILKRTLGG